MKRRWILLACVASVAAAGLAGLEAGAMSDSPPAIETDAGETCGDPGGDFVMAGPKGTIDFDGNCSGYPEESCGRPVF